jgi:transketolase
MRYSNERKKMVAKVVQLAHDSKEGHIPSSLSVLDIVYGLYQEHITKNSDHKFVLSKGHASLGLYVVLDHFGVLNADLNSFCKFDSLLGGHPNLKIPAIEASTGSLGHGMPIAVGMAMAKKIQGTGGTVFVLIGDGEANEGTIWESALLASHHKLNNLVCLLDHNHSTDRAVDIGDIMSKFSSFGWHTEEIDGHDIDAITSIQPCSNKPTFVLCNTTKGKGIDMMENNPEWHHKSPTSEQVLSILKDQIVFDGVVNTALSRNGSGQTEDEFFILAEIVERCNSISGDFAEIGIYCGVTSELIFTLKDKNKTLFLCDTFSGLVDVETGDSLENGFASFSYEDFCKRNSYVNEKEVRVVDGYFPTSTTEEMNSTKYSFVHLDVDTYKSTIKGLEYFSNRMSTGGFIVVHDYRNSICQGVKKAIDEFMIEKQGEFVLETYPKQNSTQAIIRRV